MTIYDYKNKKRTKKNVSMIFYSKLNYKTLRYNSLHIQRFHKRELSIHSQVQLCDIFVCHNI